MDVSACPICNLSVPVLELERHANEHFADEDYARDLELAQEIALIPPSPPPVVEDFITCRYNFSDSPQSNLASCHGQVNSSGGSNIDEKYASLVFSQNKEVFDEVEGSLINLLRNCLELDSEKSVSILSGHIDHFQSRKWQDAGWGCGWRNIQMLSSYLLRQRQEAREVLYGGSGFVPDIPSLQRWLELAWKKGFDSPGSDDFDQKIYGQRRWIGTTECAALFRSFGLRARIVDFCSKKFELASSVPCLSSGTGQSDICLSKKNSPHTYGPMDVFLSKGKLGISQAGLSVGESSGCSSVLLEEVRGPRVLTEWLWNYFSDNKVINSANRRVVVSEKSPLYFQHNGHSRTIIGIQAKYQQNGVQQYNLLIFDPAEKTAALGKSLRENSGWQKLIKRGPHTLKKPQYQLCFIDPGIAHGEELEMLKTLHSVRHEF